VAIFFMLTYISLAFLFIIAAFNNLIFIKNLFLLFENLRDMGNSFLTSSVLLFKLANGYGLLESVAIYFLFPLFSLPYAIINIEKRKDWYKLLMVFPFAIIYLPIYTLANVHGIILGIKKYFTVKENEQGW